MHSVKKDRKISLTIVVSALLFLLGCTGAEQSAQSSVDPSSISEAPAISHAPIVEEEAPTPTPSVCLPGPSEEPAPFPEPAVSPQPQEDTLLTLSDREGIKEELLTAIRELRQPRKMSASGVDLGEHPELEIKNLYYGLTRQFPELKYAYDLSADIDEGVLCCQILYMPYRTGDYPEGPDYVSAATLEELIAAAQANLGTESIPVRLTDPTLTPDDMSRALQQAGGGYILCALNRDGTAINCTPGPGLTMEECLSLLEEAGQLADQVIAQVVTASMTEREKAEALYSYITERVKYDQRYYSDRENMPYDSQTAIGALRDHLAICGGYSHAIKLLFEKAGILCYNVTGVYFGENHMWNAARTALFPADRPF